MTPSTAPGETGYDDVFRHFYQTVRAGAVGLSGGGGPFGFDITAAVAFHDLVSAYQPDIIVETGCFFGDTTSYLARAYPDVPVWSCDIDAGCVAVTSHRTKAHANVRVVAEDSPTLVRRAVEQFVRPLLYLDAHGHAEWPLARELGAVHDGLACIDDFDIGNTRFAFDHYDGIRCDADYVLRASSRVQHVYAMNPDAEYPFPCLQTGRRAGKGVAPIGDAAEEVCRAQPRLAHHAERSNAEAISGDHHAR